MASGEIQGLDTASAHKVLCLLDTLRHSPTGAVIYRQVERMLDDLVAGQRTVEQAYLTLVTQLLEAYLEHLREGSPLQVQVRLLQARLQPPLTSADLQALSDYVELYASQIEAIKTLDSTVFRQAVEPLLTAFGIVDEPGPVDPASVPVPGEIAGADTETAVPPADEPEDLFDLLEGPGEADSGVVENSMGEAETPESMPHGMHEDYWDTDESPDESIGPGEDVAQAVDEEARLHESTGNPDPLTGSPVDTAYRSHLDSKRRDIQKLQATLAEQVLGTIAQNEEFGVLLEVVLGELRQAGDDKELEDLRWTLIREIEKLTKGHHELAEQLDSTHHYLQLIESDSRQLSDELTRVRLLSLTDELTGLPNRRAFLRRIEDEVARVQRYGFPLSLALIDLDHFKQVNDKYGHGGGDEVLQLYSKNILSIFRHHDLVARYGGEEFAVLLPNTDAEGSLRALTKVKNRAGETRWQPNGEVIAVPTFSSGVSLYKPGETASAFIERADKALYRAKRLGRNRVEMDATYRSDEGGSHNGNDPEGDDRRRNETP